MTLAEHKRYVEERRKRSVTWQVIHVFGSLNLALFLLITIALACAIATFTESTFNSRVAQAYIYKAPWFLFWLALLVINLIAATLTRLPWLPKHRGFVITHGGIVILLFGAMIGQKAGYEAHVVLRKGEAPVSRLILNETTIQVRSDDGGDSYLIPVNLEVRQPSQSKPRIVPIPGSDLVVHIEKYAEHVEERRIPVASDAPNAVPAVKLRFSSNMMGQDVPVALLQNAGESTHNFFGLASIQLGEETAQPAADPHAGHGHSTDLLRETHVTFALHPEQTVVVPHDGERTGFSVRLIQTESGAFEVGVKSPHSDEVIHPLDQLRQTPVEIDGGQVHVKDFWGNFVMKDGKPASEGEGLENPAILVEVQAPHFHPEAQPRPQLRMKVEKDGRLSYSLNRNGSEYAKGTAAQGETILTGWADWRATVEEILPNAVAKSEFFEVESAAGPGLETSGVPGILARIATKNGGQRSDPQWVLSGRSVMLTNGKREANVGFGLRTIPVPFSIKLLNFEVPRDEGTDTPANFISTVEFTDLKTGIAEQAVSKMNHPAIYPSGTWRLITGFNHKFSQASWNPEDLNETTLQVLHDPGWSLKWIGSLMICVGIAIMFYLKPKPGGRKDASIRKAPAPSREEATV